MLRGIRKRMFDTKRVCLHSTIEHEKMLKTFELVLKEIQTRKLFLNNCIDASSCSVLSVEEIEIFGLDSFDKIQTIVTESTTEHLVFGTELMLQQLIRCFFSLKELREFDQYIQSENEDSKNQIWLSNSISTVILLHIIDCFNRITTTDQDIQVVAKRFAQVLGLTPETLFKLVTHSALARQLLGNTSKAANSQYHMILTASSRLYASTAQANNETESLVWLNTIAARWFSENRLNQRVLYRFRETLTQVLNGSELPPLVDRIIIDAIEPGVILPQCSEISILPTADDQQMVEIYSCVLYMTTSLISDF